jgi:HEPN domain-containing protein
MPFVRELDVGVVLPLWESAPYGVVPLLEMLRLYADIFLKLFSEIEAIGSKCSALELVSSLTESSKTVPQDRCLEVYAKTGVFAGLCGQHGLSSTASKCARIHRTLEERHMRATYGELHQWLGELRDRLEDELRSELFLHLRPSEARFYELPTEEWKESISKFHQITSDVEEAAKCFALGRYTGAVFHLQRVMEFGLKTLAVKVGKPFDKNTWDAHLKDIEKELEARYKAAGARTSDESFYSEAAAQIGHVKVAWRNPTMHIDRTYTEEVAKDIWNAVKAFMRHLSAKLP